MQAPPVRRQSSSGQKPPQQQEGGPQWARGQGLPPPVKKAGRGNSRGSFSEPPMDFKPLVKSENHWRPKKNSSALVVAEKKVKSILNKMTKEKFETLSQQMCEIPLESYETLSMMIRFVYEKAIDEPSFGDMYADLCALLSRTAQTSSFVHFIQSDEEKDNGSPQVWRWSNDVSHDDGEIVGPFEDEDDAFDAALADETMAPIERGEMTLELVRLRIANDTFIKILKNTENDDHYVVFFPMKEAEECGQQMSEFFLTERECRSDASKHNSFKRSLLNKCQDEFNKQDIYEDWKKEKASYLETKDSLTEAEQTEKEGELNFRRIKIKKQMLGNIKFIGQLYKKNLLKEKIMRYCIATLLKLDEDKSISGKNTEYIDSGQTDLDEEDHEALCSMFSTIGKTIDTPEAADFMDVCFTKIERFSDDKAQNSRSRFMYKDLIELRKNSWEPRRKQEKAKTLEEIRKDVEREELLHAQESQKFAPGRGGGRGGRGSNIGGRGFMRGGGDRRQTDHMVQPGRGRSSFKSQDDDSFAGRGGSFRFSSSGGRGDRRGSASSPTRTSARQVSPTPGQGGHGSSTSLRSAAARSVSPSPPGPSSFAPPPMSGEKLERRIDGMRTEYMQDPGNVPELLLSMDGISGTPGAGFIFVQRNADRVMDCKDEERKAIIDMIKILFQKEKLSKEDIENGMGEIVEFVDSFVIDSPRAYEYIGDVVSELLNVGAVDVQWLAMQTEKTKLSPESAVPERVVKDVMAAFVNKFGKEKAHTVFDDGVEKLAEVLGIDKWNTIAGSVMG
jgi:translation initiation factor 4G